MTCEACAAHAKNPTSGAYKGCCQQCAIRSIAKSPAYWESQRLGAITAGYRAALERAFAGDVKAGHAAVKNFVEKLKVSDKRQLTLCVSRCIIEPSSTQ